jgi:hypothetical protein
MFDRRFEMGLAREHHTVRLNAPVFTTVINDFHKEVIDHAEMNKGIAGGYPFISVPTFLKLWCL